MKNRSTNYSPFELLHGYEPKTSISIRAKELEREREDKIVKDINEKRNIGRENLLDSRMKTKEIYDKKNKIKKININPGDKVLLKEINPGKYEDHWNGPMIVEKKSRGNNIIVRDDDGETLEVNSDEIKEFKEDKVVESLMKKNIGIEDAISISNLLRQPKGRVSRHSEVEVADIQTEWGTEIEKIVNHEVNNNGELIYEVKYKHNFFRNEERKLYAKITKGKSACSKIVKSYWSGEMLEVSNQERPIDLGKEFLK